jgi:hypothetical protein
MPVVRAKMPKGKFPGNHRRQFLAVCSRAVAPSPALEPASESAEVRGIIVAKQTGPVLNRRTYRKVTA